MGGNESHSSEVLKYFDKQWQYIYTNPQGTKTYRNRDNDKEAEAHNVAIDPKKPIMKEYDIYNYRRTQDNALVGVYAVQDMKQKAPNLCGDRDIWKVMVESIPVRGNNLNNLNFNESVYVLSESIRGYDDCYSKVGRFHIDENMMGLNKAGHLKVWLNESFAENHPTDQKPMLQITNASHLKDKTVQEEQRMLRELTSIVQRKSRDRFPADFRELVNKQTTFADAYDSIEDYCGVKQIEVPDRIFMEGMGSNERHGNIYTQANVVQSVNSGHKSVPSFNGTVEPTPDNFSFKNFTPKQPIQQRETFINNLTFLGSQQKQNHMRASSPQALHSNAHQSIYIEPSSRIRDQSAIPVRFEESKMSLKGIQPQSHIVHRTTSPAVSPRGINFSYQNNQRYVSPSPNRPNNVISRRF